MSLHPSEIARTNITNSHEICGICRDDFNHENSGIQLRKIQTKTSFLCGHFFHSACLRPWLQDHKYCPHCFRPLKLKMTLKKIAAITFEVASTGCVLLDVASQEIHTDEPNTLQKIARVTNSLAHHLRSVIDFTQDCKSILQGGDDERIVFGVKVGITVAQMVFKKPFILTCTRAAGIWGTLRRIFSLESTSSRITSAIRIAFQCTELGLSLYRQNAALYEQVREQYRMASHSY